jgi:pimeloyl-ACP methyl ester carboxylesterase
LILTACLFADGPGDNQPDKVRPIPPAGIAIPEDARKELQAGADDLGKQIEALRQTLTGKADLLELLPDVQIFHNAVRYPLAYNEFYDLKDVDIARTLLRLGRERAAQLREGKAPWTSATGLVVRGYRSKIDGSVQPYGLVVPKSYQPDTLHSFRLDVWCHGRGETLTELKFLDGRLRSPGEFTPANTFVLHLYGRYCCANKFAGEVDCFEALADVQKHYPIDENRLVVRGFSMGGAACWHLAVHHAGVWCAAAPGAGFSETPEFLRVFQNEKIQPNDYEKKLLHWYDCTDWAANLFNCPVIAYSGAKDKQKQAADAMGEAMRKEGLTLLHLVGPDTGHSYEPRTKAELARRMDRLAARGRDPAPAHVVFTTYTLRYNRMLWVRIDGLGKHWDKATVDATHSGEIEASTQNVSALSFHFDSGDCPLEALEKPKVTLDEQELQGPPVLSDRSWHAHFRRKDGAWEVVEKLDETGLRKRHGLQGPIDDAFMDSFLMVKPTGKPLNDKVGAWVMAEMSHALEHWRKQFRGEARVKNDDAVNEADIREHNLVLWGDPSSNHVLARIADRLPLRWQAQEIRAGKETFAAAHHAPVLIYPNPLNPKRYVVLNSGFTFREYDYLNNARQIARLPDWAVIDLRTPPGTRLPGAVAAAGFFDEEWKLPAAK